MKFNRRSKLQAFSLIEISVVILIIGIFIAGALASSGMISKFRIAAAQSLTLASPINATSDAALWLETSLDSSFNSSETNNGSALSTWYDQRNSTNKVTISTAGVSPIYSNTINRIHAVEFDGTSNKNFTFDGSFLNGTDYTIFVLEKRKSANSNNYFLGSSSSGANDGLALGYSADSTIIHAQGSNSYSSSITSYSNSKDAPRIFAFTSDSTDGKKTYINGLLAAQSSNTAKLSGVTTLAIGQGYVGEIGEIAIFTRALKTSERTAIEDYIGKKWTATIARNSAPSGSCVGYTVTSTGCDLTSATCNISQTGISASVSPTSTPTSISCNLAGYTGSSVSYTCINAVANVTGSCSCATGYSGVGCADCDAGAGYVSGSGGTCVLAAGCNTNTVIGVSSPATVAHLATGSLTCNGTNFSGLATVTYSCNNGSLNPSGTCGCASGYELISGACQAISCTVPSTVGTNTTTVNQASGTVPCNQNGAGGGPANYTCVNGTFTVTGNACTTAKCSGGNTTLFTVAGETIHAFVTVGTTSLTCSVATNAQVLVVGGGGSGGNGYGQNGGGGGGAGGFVYAAAYPLTTVAPYTVTVGSGGATQTIEGAAGNNGGNSVFDAITANGGGGGGYRNGAAATPGLATSGGSGGGGPFNGPGAAATQMAQPNETYHYGNAGGSGHPTSTYITGGGGGAGGVGANGTSTKSGDGGAGMRSDITGSGSYYAAGGGGGSGGYSNHGFGGSSIGGNGGSSPTAGVANTGSGGGGTDGGNVSGGAGGSGIVIVRYTN